MESKSPVVNAAIDTNILLRLILRDDPVLERKARELIDRKKALFYVPDMAIAEAVYVLQKKQFGLPREAIAQYLSAVLAEPRLDYDHPLFNNVFAAYVMHPKLSFTDCYLAYKAEDFGRTPLYTFDQKLARQLPSTKLV